jgi:uncharacterized membrane protein YuzA (DUF378 family)
MQNLNGFDWLCLLLVIVGGLNWGMIGIFNIDLVSTVFGVMTTLTQIVYVVVGAAALYSVYILSAKVQ